MVSIKQDVKDVLSQSKIENNQLFLPNIQLDKGLYVDINKILELLGGKWNKKLKCHIFDQISTEEMNRVLNGEDKIVNVKKTYQAFFTPANLAKEVVELAEVENKTVLEPSAGSGNIAVECRNQGAEQIDCIEIQKENYDSLKEKGFETQNVDFLSINPTKLYDTVVGNPPYSKNDWLKHLLHAWKFVKNGGRLVFILPNNPNHKKLVEFLDDKDYEIIENEDGAFKESGTNVSTIILILNK